jgi:hypothetical protein
MVGFLMEVTATLIVGSLHEELLHCTPTQTCSIVKATVAQVNCSDLRVLGLRTVNVRPPLWSSGYRTEMYCVSCEVRTEFLYDV